MDHNNPLSALEANPDYQALTPDRRSQLEDMARNMAIRQLPNSVIASGLRSTARLLLEQQRAETPRIQSDEVRRFLQANQGTQVTHASSATPRRETRAITNDRLHELLGSLLEQASKATRRHEILRVRREMLALDQGHIRRVLGSEGAAYCEHINAWLLQAAARLKRG